MASACAPYHTQVQDSIEQTTNGNVAPSRPKEASQSRFAVPLGMSMCHRDTMLLRWVVYWTYFQWIPTLSASISLRIGGHRRAGPADDSDDDVEPGRQSS
jgi:hypothetical protein